MSNRVLLGLLVSVLLLSVILAASCTEPTMEELPSSPSESAPEPSSPPEPIAQVEWKILPRATQTLPEGEKVMKWDEPPSMTIDTSKKYRAIMETEKGNLVLELFAKDVPITVNNFIFLATQGYYDDTTFHRVLPGFMVQGGDPTGTGAGGPGYRFGDEFTEHGHVAGALSMANTGPNTNGSQFFVTYVPVHQLDGRHSVFGQLTENMDVLKSITPRDPQQNPGFEGDKIIRVIIEVSS